ncbi:MAG: hypothetical protein HGA96_17415 [Desulfobulbaceae bacterium]|nr:hypothetical protein [Desulfobulbaceae bacterium]
MSKKPVPLQPDVRVLNHFHDPVYPAPSWSNAGYGIFYSALVWAQEDNQSSSEYGTTYSWVAARNSFYNALITGSESEYATTFRALGQVMHLVSDMAVPAHVRNDNHLYYLRWARDNYEDFTTGQYDEEIKKTPSLYDNSYPVSPTVFSRAVTSTSYPATISALFDQDACVNSSVSGCNPDSLWTQDAGLAEFTNANFMSRDTFANYTYPASNTDLTITPKWHDRAPVVARDNKIDYPAYIERVVPNGPSYKLAAMNYFRFWGRDIYLLMQLCIASPEITQKLYVCGCLVSATSRGAARR